MMTIAPLNHAHLPQLIAITQATPFGESWTEQNLASELKIAQSLAVFDGARKVVAFVLFRTSGPDLEIMWLGTEASQLRQGHQRRLLDAIYTAHYGAGGERLLLEVRADNQAAIGLYGSLGFSEIGRRKGYYPNGVDALVLARAIQEP